MNPQLSISLTEADEVVLALNQHTATDPKVSANDNMIHVVKFISCKNR